MKTYNKKYGKVEITKETETHTTFITDEGEEKTVINTLAPMLTKEEYIYYCSECVVGYESERIEKERITREGIDAHGEIEEINRIGRMNQRPSSMR